LDEAIASFRTALMLNPGYIASRYRIGVALLLKGEPLAALAEMQQEQKAAKRLEGDAIVYHTLGQIDASDAALAELIDKYERSSAYNIAYVLAFRGEADRAFAWLDKAVQYNDAGLPRIVYQPEFTNIHDDPRWLSFLVSIGQSPEQLAAIEFKVALPK
jgi:tetratricopeptide (TPR) repeat protein